MNVSLRPLGVADGQCVGVNSERLLIGRAEGCDLQLHNGMVSRRHAEVIVSDDVVIRDLESSNGTFVNGDPVAVLRRLRDGDVVSFALVPW
jgi:pSer/pThr/pTyr-binding forkhead associated (FHA) protein